jgi:hypothetical protein
MLPPLLFRPTIMTTLATWTVLQKRDGRGTYGGTIDSIAQSANSKVPGKLNPSWMFQQKSRKSIIAQRSESLAATKTAETKPEP